ncbi:MAG TPA: AMP-binding protein [Acidimicrobiales bacterium]|nr:AMP-binding protein [Acidimicrobiales bacterium]
MRSMADAWAARAGDPNPGLRHEGDQWSWARVVDEASRRAAWWAGVRHPGPPHVAVLLDNVPEHHFWLGACALSGAVYVGANPTHPGPALAGELAFTRCQVLVTDRAHLELLEGHDLGPAIGVATAENPRVHVVDGEDAEGLPPDASVLDVDEVRDLTLGYLIFTSGTSGSPKACRCTQGRMVVIGAALMDRYQLGPGSCCYLSMPLFHSNCLMSGWAPAVVGGATIALPTGGRFSASGFLPDVRRHGVTYWNYVGRPLSYVLATPERADDAETTLHDVFGNEAAPGDVDRFARRFGCSVSENYGSTEGGIAISRTPDTPEGALGPAPPGVLVANQEGEECPVARFDRTGRLLNALEAVGEIVTDTIPPNFEGYWENEEADQARVRDGRYWSGDLAYKDADGYLYFAGRGDDWLRVDGENFAAAPVVRIIDRHPDVVISAVYAVPDPSVGDQVMAAVQLRPGSTFDGRAFGAFLSEQADLGRKWVPRYVRVSHTLPTTATSKILVRRLRTEGVDCDDPVYERVPGDTLTYVEQPTVESSP